mmetsp:Transcript_50595/g.120484  ORF Transcript_50595/g.120484 Transcript_50595/m.120484 type:complete len:232 (+) Transcript_50595:2-697(+)
MHRGHKGENDELLDEFGDTELMGRDRDHQGQGEMPDISKLSVVGEIVTRGRWLFVLMVFQSGSSIVLQHYEKLVREHLVLTLFLTMLVGAGGNAGAQSAMGAIKDLSRDSKQSWRRVLWRQTRVAAGLGVLLAMVAWVRVYLFYGGALNSFAISLSCFVIVVSSVVIGAALPFLMIYAGFDPVHSGAAVQVLMDLWGVMVSCAVCAWMLSTNTGGAVVAPTGFPEWPVEKT